MNGDVACPYNTAEASSYIQVKIENQFNRLRDVTYQTLLSVSSFYLLIIEDDLSLELLIL